MATYYKHKATRSRKVLYSFQCEHCMKDSGPLTAEIAGATAEENSVFSTLKPDKQAGLEKAAFSNLEHTARETYKNATEKQVYSEAFRAECAYCGKPQSWGIAGAKSNALSSFFAILVVGIIVCAGVYFTQGQNLRLTLGFAGVFVAIAAGYAIVKAVALALKKQKANAAVQKNLPSINWAPIQDLLQ